MQQHPGNVGPFLQSQRRRSCSWRVMMLYWLCAGAVMPVEDGVLFVASLRDHLLASAPAGNEKPAAAPAAGKGRKRRAAKMAAPEPDAAVRPGWTLMLGNSVTQGAISGSAQEHHMQCCTCRGWTALRVCCVLHNSATMGATCPRPACCPEDDSQACQPMVPHCNTMAP